MDGSSQTQLTFSLCSYVFACQSSLGIAGAGFGGASSGMYGAQQYGGQQYCNGLSGFGGGGIPQQQYSLGGAGIGNVGNYGNYYGGASPTGFYTAAGGEANPALMAQQQQPIAAQNAPVMPQQPIAQQQQQQPM